MPHVGPISRRDLIRALRDAGFEGPFAGRSHAFMSRRDRSVIIPNPHGADIDTGLLRTILGSAGISRQEWERL